MSGSERKLLFIKRTCSCICFKESGDRSQRLARANDKLEREKVGCRRKKEEGRKGTGSVGGKSDPYTKG